MKKKVLSIVLSLAVLACSLIVVSGMPMAAVTNDVGDYAYENFEMMSADQAAAYFGGQIDDYMSYSATIVDNFDATGSKALEATLDTPYDWSWINYNGPVLDIPENAVAVQLTYKVSKDCEMRLQLKDITAGGWTELAFEGSKDSKGAVTAGTYTKTVSLESGYNANDQHALAFEVKHKAGNSGEIKLTFDNITFITAEVYEDFEAMSADQAAAYFGGQIDDYMSYSATVVDNYDETGSKALEATLDTPYDWSWINYNGPVLDIPAAVKSVQLTYTVSKDCEMRLQLKDITAGGWTELAFEGSKDSKGAVTAGTYTKTVDLDSDYNANDQHALAFEVKHKAGNSGEIKLTIDNITFLRYGSSAAGDITALSDKIAEVEAMDSALYTEASWAALQTALTNARAVTADDTQRTMDQALEALTFAIGRLEPATTDKSALQTAMDAAKAMLDDPATATTYTEASIQNLQAKYDAAQAVFDDADALQSAIDAAKNELNGAVDGMVRIPSDADLKYPATANETFMNFENYEDDIDLNTPVDYGSHLWSLDTALTHRLETKNAISGSKSLKVSWGTLASGTWPKDCYYFFGRMKNQALYFDLVCPVDWNAKICIYDEKGGPMYEIVRQIKGSNDVQHILLPFNEFVSNKDGVAMTRDAFIKFTQQNDPKVMFQIQINKDAGGLPDKSFLLMDNFMLVTEDFDPATIDRNYETMPGEEPGPGPDKPDPEKPDPEKPTPGGDVDVDVSGDMYTELTKLDAPANTLTLAADELVELGGNGFYATVKAAADDVMHVTITDGAKTLKYDIPVAKSDADVLVSADYTDFVDANATFRELDFAKIKVEVTFDSETTTLSSFGCYTYRDNSEKPGTDNPGEDKPGEDKPGENKPGEDKPGEDKPGENKPSTDKPGEDKPGENKPSENKPSTDKPGSTSPETGDATAAAVACIVLIAALGTVVAMTGKRQQKEAAK